MILHGQEHVCCIIQAHLSRIDILDASDAVYTSGHSNVFVHECPRDGAVIIIQISSEATMRVI